MLIPTLPMLGRRYPFMPAQPGYCRHITCLAALWMALALSLIPPAISPAQASDARYSSAAVEHEARTLRKNWEQQAASRYQEEPTRENLMYWCRIRQYLYWSEDDDSLGEKDIDECSNLIRAKAPLWTETLLWLLQHQQQDEEAVALLNLSIKPLLDQWPLTDQLRYYQLISQHYEWTDAPDIAARYRLRSRYLSDTLPLTEGAARLLLKTDEIQARQWITHDLNNPEIDSWQRSYLFEIAVEMMLDDAALEFYELADNRRNLYGTEQYAAARLLLRHQRYDEAHQIMADELEGDHEATSKAMQWFDLNLALNQEQAITAYQLLRQQDILADVTLFRRAQLALTYPASGWLKGDGKALFYFGLMFFILMMMPAILLVPVHYWGLIRQRQNKTRSFVNTAWNLRHAWIILAGYLLAVVASNAYWANDYFMQTLLDITLLPNAVENIREQMLSVDLFTAILLLILARHGGVALSRGTWPAAKIFGVALGSAVLLLIAYLMLIFPQQLSQAGLSGQHSLAMAAGGQSGAVIQLIEALLQNGGPLAAFLIVAVATPVIEETLFRGVLLTAMGRHIPFYAANILQAGLFMVFHDAAVGYPYYFLVGITAGWLYRRSGSLATPMMMHFIINSIALLIVFAAR